MVLIAEFDGVARDSSYPKKSLAVSGVDVETWSDNLSQQP
jgi:hypothetical protein